MKLTHADYVRAAEALGCEVAAIQAVARVESSGGGFFPDGRPKILFEAHVFSRLTKGEFDTSHPHLSSRRWNRALYRGGIREYDRLEEAKKLAPVEALSSCSWGRFQIMGFNHKAAGFATVHEFVEAMHESEGRHLDAFAAFVVHAGLADELRRRDWAGFARGYNGPAFRENQYDTKIASAYARFSKGTVV